MSVDAATFADEMDRIADHLTDGLEDILQDSIVLIQANVQQNFDQSQTAGWTPWPVHAPSTIKRYGPHPLLILSGTLEAAATGRNQYHFEEITKEQGGARLRYGIDGLPYAAVHQFGGGNNIPQREYLAISDGTVEKIVEAVGEHQLEKFAGR